MATTVQYDGNSLVPAPYVSRSYEPKDYGKRWGVEEIFELRGFYTGSTGHESTITNLSNKFTGQFRRFKVTSNGNDIIDEPYTVVEEVSIDSSRFLRGEPLSYSAKLRAFHVPSGVIDPSNEYSFDLGEDGIVSVTHKVSARGVRTNKNPLQNAIDFVSTFVGQNPYQYCNPIFIDNSSGILFSRAETIDRLGGEYSVSEVYKYNTGVGTSQNYVVTHSAEITEGVNNDYNTVDFNAEYRGSTINGSLSALRSSVNAKSFLQQVYDFYGFNTGSLLLNTFSISEDSGRNAIVVRASYLSGAASDLTGYFDYSINLEVDETFGLQTYTLDGNFVTKGPLSVRREAVENFKNSIGEQYTDFAYGLITSSELYSVFKDTNHPLCSAPLNLTLSHNTGLARFSMNVSFDNRDCADYAQQIDYSVKVDAAKPVYKLVPSANIEGHYVIQDLQCLTQERTEFAINAVTSGNNPNLENDLDALYNTLKSAIIGGQATLQSVNSNSGQFTFSKAHSVYSDANISLYVNFFDTRVGSYVTRRDGSKFGY